MELSPRFKVEEARQQARDSLTLAMKAHEERSLALLIDTAIESSRTARDASRLGEPERGELR